MPPANPLAMPSLLLSALVLSAAAFLAWRQRTERQGRSAQSYQTAIDAAFYAGQDRRRRRGTILMSLIGLAISVSAWINPRAGVEEARFVFAVWIAIGALLCVMVGFAIWDGLVTAAYARFVRRSLAQERQRLMGQPRPRGTPETSEPS